MNTSPLSQAIEQLPTAARRMTPRHLWRSPVMLVVWIGSVLCTVSAVADPGTFTIGVTIWLWLTVLFGNLAEAIAEGRGKARAASLRAARSDTVARRLDADGGTTEVSGAELRVGERIVVEAGEVIAGDGEVVEGIASVDESAITGESAPVVREAVGDRSAVTGGTRVLSDRIVVEITAAAGETFLDTMIALVEGTSRRKTPNEIALSILLSGLSLVFLVVVATLAPIAGYAGQPLDVVVLVALLVCLIPTTIGALLPAIGIAGMDRLVRVNVLATSGRAVEAAGDVTTLLLDKTGTITYGNRRAVAFHPAPGVTREQLRDDACRASLADRTPEGRSIVDLARADGAATDEPDSVPPPGSELIEFSARTRMSGIDLPDGTSLRKGAGSAITVWVGSDLPAAVTADIVAISGEGGTPLVIARRDGAHGHRVLGVVHLKDIVKDGMRERFGELRARGIRTVMITGDNELTARAIAAEAGVDDVLAEATPEDKMAYIRKEQEGGRLVAMTGDGTNDAPALAAADVGVAMNSGTSAAKEAGNMVDLDSDPTKLIDVVEVGKQLLITRGALTTFSIANDVAKYFAIIPALFVTALPSLEALNLMRLSSPESAILSAVIFNALVIVALVPVALRGVRARAASASAVLRRNLLVFGLGGLVLPFAGIKLIDLLISLIPGIG